MPTESVKGVRRAPSASGAGNTALGLAGFGRRGPHGGRVEVSAQADLLAADRTFAEYGRAGKSLATALVIRVRGVARLPVAIAVGSALGRAIRARVEITRNTGLYGWFHAQTGRAVGCVRVVGALQGGRALRDVARPSDGLVFASRAGDQRAGRKHQNANATSERRGPSATLGARLVEHRGRKIPPIAVDCRWEPKGAHPLPRNGPDGQSPSTPTRQMESLGLSRMLHMRLPTPRRRAWRRGRAALLLCGAAARSRRTRCSRR